METIQIKLSFTIKDNKLLEKTDVQVNKQVFDSYIKGYIHWFAKERRWFKTGKMSGKVLLAPRSFESIAAFAKNVPEASHLERSIFSLNASLVEKYNIKFGSRTWLEVDEIIIKNHRKEIIEHIIDTYSIPYPPTPNPLQTKTYDFASQEVVFLLYKSDEFGDFLYAVPKAIAINLSLEDFDGDEVGRFDTLWKILHDYKVNRDIFEHVEHMTMYSYE